MGEEMSDSESVTAISEDQLALLITTSIQTLKRKKNVVEKRYLTW